MKRLSFLILLCPVFFLLACGDDDTEIQLDPIIFYDNGDYLLQATCTGDDIEFFLDAVMDITDGSMGAFPNSDIYRIYVDYNDNKTIDANIDLLISPLEDGRICTVKLLTAGSTTGCSFANDITGETLFSSTENTGEAHINHRLRLPKTVLSSGSSVGLVVELYDSETGWQRLPEGGDVFGRTINLSW